MPLNTNLTDLVRNVAAKTSRIYTWAKAEFTKVYASITDVANAIPTGNAELTNTAGYAKNSTVQSELAKKVDEDLKWNFTGTRHVIASTVLTNKDHFVTVGGSGSIITINLPHADTVEIGHIVYIKQMYSNIDVRTDIPTGRTDKIYEVSSHNLLRMEERVAYVGGCYFASYGSRIFVFYVGKSHIGLGGPLCS